MPKVLFYAGTAFCLFLALTSAAEAVRELDRGVLAFVALPQPAAAVSAIAVALVASLAIAALFLRMAALLAARNLFASFVALLCVAASTASLAGLLFLQWRMATVATHQLDEVHFAAIMAVGFFVSLSLLSLRPYFSIQASRFLSALVFFPLPLFVLMLAQEMFVSASAAPLPAATPASRVYFATLALLFFSIAVHCIRHRHLFIEMTNLRELLDPRVDPASRHGRPIGGVAFDT
ncbi:MAG: hypothetical protein JO197_11925 [Acidobacteria bacterium]|nr:hypothetical protein [Acidobacteriota bacterium]MBV9476185.1 hypothetical protein [Acidobacteriota bacterium]